MKLWTQLRNRYRSIARQSQLEEELDDEIRFHMEMEVERNIASGLSPAEAKRAATIAFGGVEQTKEECRSRWGARLVFDFWRDLRLGLRRLLKDRGYTSAVFLSLSLGIGAVITIFAFLNAYLLKPLPYPDEDRLTVINPINEAFGPMSVSYANYLDWAERNATFETIACARFLGYNLTGIEIPERLNAFQASQGFLPLLGAEALHGRLFGARESQRDAAPTVVLSHRLWQRLYSGNPGAIGETMVLDGELHTIIGVLPPDFRFPPLGQESVEAWTPIERQERDSGFLQRWAHQGTIAVGKLKEGVTLDQAQADLDRVTQQIEAEHPDTNIDDGVLAQNARESLHKDRRPALLMLMAAVACLLVIVCVNIAGLIAARAASRHQELAFRAALGAKRWDIIRQLLSENVVLTVLGSVGGLVAAIWGTRILHALMGDQSELLEAPAVLLDRKMALCFVSITLGVGLLFSLFPFFQVSALNGAFAAQGATRTASAGKRHQRARQALVVAEIAMALVILSAAGLLLRSYKNYLATDPGYNLTNVLTAELELPAGSYDSEQKRINFYHAFLAKAKSLPGIQHVGLSSTLLGGNQSTYVIEERPPAADAQAPFAERASITPDLIPAMGIRLIAGRLFNDRDTADSLPVALIDERFAQRWWPQESPIGKRLQFGSSAKSDGTWLEIVGVVSHVKHQGIDQDSRESVFQPASQNAFRNIAVVARATSDPLGLVAPLRRALSEVDAQLTLAEVRTLQEIASNQSYARRFLTAILSLFAVAALLLAALGIYGVTAYAVAQRAQEFGIRVALGGRRQDVVGLVLRNGAKLTGLGIGLGLVAALSLSSLARSLVFGVSAFDPWTFALTTLALSGCVLAACYLPARRAGNADPMRALRME